jgi:hypothetical protein
MSETLLQEAIAETTEGWKPDPIWDLYAKTAIKAQKLSGIVGHYEGTILGLLRVQGSCTKEEIIAQLSKAIEDCKQKWNELYQS